uniref:Uncharacterized protein n=1 Tax=Phasianus colchicus TaxID=9054 RepID=A0A669PMB5_PHACC
NARTSAAGEASARRLAATARSIPRGRKGPLKVWLSSTRSPINAQSSTHSPINAQSSTRSPINAQSSTHSPIRAQSSTHSPIRAQSSTHSPIRAQSPPSLTLAVCRDVTPSLVQPDGLGEPCCCAGLPFFRNGGNPEVSEAVAFCVSKGCFRLMESFGERVLLTSS